MGMPVDFPFESSQADLVCALVDFSLIFIYFFSLNFLSVSTYLSELVGLCLGGSIGVYIQRDTNPNPWYSNCPFAQDIHSNGCIKV